MHITGRSTQNVDVIVWEEDYLTQQSLDGLLNRVAQTSADEQFFFREAEFDAAFRQVVIELSNLPHGASLRRDLLEQVRHEIWVGHDFIGERNAFQAQASVSRLVTLIHGAPLDENS